VFFSSLWGKSLEVGTKCRSTSKTSGFWLQLHPREMSSLLPVSILLALLSPLLAKEVGESKGKDIPSFSMPRVALSVI
jgi:hypothetical protein